MSELIWQSFNSKVISENNVNPLVLAAAFIAISVPTFAKRMAPAEVKPVVSRGFEYAFRTEQHGCHGNDSCSMHVYLISQKKLSGKIIWKQEIYQKIFNPLLETDVQAIFPVSLKLIKKQLHVVDEGGSKYSIDPKTGQLITPALPKIYPAK